MTVFGSKKKSSPKSLRRSKETRPNATYTPVKYESGRFKTLGRWLSVAMGVASLIAMFFVLTAAPSTAEFTSGIASVGTAQLAALLGLVGLGGIVYPIATHIRDKRFHEIMSQHEADLAELGLSDEELLDDFLDQQHSEDEVHAEAVSAAIEVAAAERKLARRQDHEQRKMAARDGRASRDRTEDMIVVGGELTKGRAAAALGTAATGLLINFLTFKWIFLNPDINIMWSKHEPGFALVFWGVLIAILGTAMVLGPLGSLMHDWLTLRGAEKHNKRMGVSRQPTQDTVLDFGESDEVEVSEQEKHQVSESA